MNLHHLQERHRLAGRGEHEFLLDARPERLAGGNDAIEGDPQPGRLLGHVPAVRLTRGDRGLQLIDGPLERRPHRPNAVGERKAFVSEIRRPELLR